MVRFLALGALALVAGCASGGAGVEVGNTFTMAVGEQVSLPDASALRYAGIGNDSRCPPDVQCIRAGDADVLFDHVPRNGRAMRITLNTERTPDTTLGDWRLRLVDLAPRGDAPAVAVRFDAANGGTAP
jgi:hypothetical protein